MATGVYVSAFFFMTEDIKNCINFDRNDYEKSLCLKCFFGRERNFEKLKNFFLKRPLYKFDVAKMLKVPTGEELVAFSNYQGRIIESVVEYSPLVFYCQAILHAKFTRILE